MKFSLVLLLFTGLICSCTIERTVLPMNEEEEGLLQSFQALDGDHQPVIAGEREPGERLWLCLTFVAKSDGEALVGKRVRFYHTSASGDYEPSDPSDESTARLSGAAVTNERGEIFLKTILPGDYGSSEDNRHIHTTVEGANPEAYDIHFKQYTGAMGKNFIDGSDQHFLANLKRTDQGVLVAFLTIEAKGFSE